MASLGSEVIEIEALRVRNDNSNDTPFEEQEASSSLSRTTKIALLALTVFIPIPFGAVHNSFYLPISAFIFALAAAHLILSRTRIEEIFMVPGASRAVMKFLLAFLAYVFLQTLYLSFSAEPHPVLGSAGGILRRSALWSGISMIAFFIATFFLARLYLIRESSFKRKLLNAILFSGVIVSLIGVTHWFYDTGKLFWMFGPENLFISERARWPFVNANHLGHFLIPIFFLFIARLSNELETVGDYQRRHQKNDRQTLSNLAHSSRLQTRLVKVAFTFCFLLGVLLALVGTLSRGTWFGLSIGIVCYILLSRKPHASTDNETAEYSTRRRRHSKDSQLGSSKRRNPLSVEAAIKWLRRLARPTFVLLAALFLVFFFSERGTDLVSARIDYGLMYSKDDMRWQLYADTIPMIKEHALLGVGLGGWSSEYPRYMNHLLSGMNPVYLHSEPMQLLAELGLIGSLLVLGLIVYCSLQALTAISILRTKEPAKARNLMAIICGLWSFFAASFFDFPLRMPAIVFTLAIYLAFTVAYSDIAKRLR